MKSALYVRIVWGAFLLVLGFLAGQARQIKPHPLQPIQVRLTVPCQDSIIVRRVSANYTNVCAEIKQ